MKLCVSLAAILLLAGARRVANGAFPKATENPRGKYTLRYFVVLRSGSQRRFSIVIGGRTKRRNFVAWFPPMLKWDGIVTYTCQPLSVCKGGHS